MDEFLKYISSFDPDFPRTISGASDEEIEAFERLTAVTFPTIYRDFLSRMGRGTGTLVVAWDCTFEIDRLIELYREAVIPGEIEVPPEHVIIGSGGVVVEQAYLQVDERGGSRVFYLGEDETLNLYAEAFDKLLFRLAFTKYQPPRHKYVAQLAGVTIEPVIEKARGLATSLGFEEQWFSDSIAFCGVKENAALIINQYEQGAPLVIAASQDKADLDAIKKTFKASLNLS
ncbi:MAG TPA: SMI1/KNR4 family protein [Blastocatellia bacterium]|nr:SMI1/KNR4 family protein [Blastocatellia bacterium]